MSRIMRLSTGSSFVYAIPYFYKWSSVLVDYEENVATIDPGDYGIGFIPVFETEDDAVKFLNEVESETTEEYVEFNK